jgi:hypothetical protein
MNDRVVGVEAPISRSSREKQHLTLPQGLGPISLRSHLLSPSITKSAMEIDASHKINPRFSERSSRDLHFSGRTLHIFGDVQEKN